ncbi:ankyrin repeat-containing domain protein [Aspergillus californicus]
MSKKAPRIAIELWEKQKEHIIALYLEPQSTLELMMSLMKEQHGFEASKNQYRARLKFWGVGKNASPEIWDFVNRRIKKRKLEGKESAVVLFGHHQPQRKVIKEIARNVTFRDTLRELADASTPDGVSVVTPTDENPAPSPGAVSDVIISSLQAPNEIGQIARDTLIQLPVEALVGYSRKMNYLLNGFKQSVTVESSLSWEIEECFFVETGDSLYLPLDDEATEQAIMSCGANSSVSDLVRDLVKGLNVLIFLLTNHFIRDAQLYSDFWNSSESILPPSSHQSFLSGAIELGNPIITRLVFDGGVPVSLQNSLLSHAVRRQDLKTVVLLCGSGTKSDISIDGPISFTGKNDSLLLDVLLRAGAEPDHFIRNEDPGYPLIQTAKNGSLDAVVLLLEYGASVNAYIPTYLGTALQAATAFGHCEVVKRLVLSGADIHAPNDPKYQFPRLDILTIDPRSEERKIATMTPIQLAAERNDISLVAFLWSGPFSDAPHVSRRPEEKESHTEKILTNSGYNSLTALQYACLNQNLKMIDILLSGGASPESGATINSGHTPLQLSVMMNDEKSVRRLLAAGAYVNSPPKHVKGRTALQMAAEGGSIPLARILLREGSNINAPASHEGGMTTLQAAAFQGHDLMVDFLCARDADINAPPAVKGGLTALQAAAAGGHATTLRTLIERGADVNGPPSVYDGRTALQAALPHRDLSIVMLLINNGAVVDPVQSDFCGSPLQEACKIGWLVGVKVLLGCGADPNPPPSLSCGTPLQESARMRCFDGVKLLLEYGAVVDGYLENNPLTEGKLTALGWSINHNDHLTMRELLRNGADLCYPVTGGDRPPGALHSALLWNCDHATVKLIVQQDKNLDETLCTLSAVAIAIRAGCSDLQVYELLLDSMALLSESEQRQQIQDAWESIQPTRQSSANPAIIHVLGLLLRASADVYPRNPYLAVVIFENTQGCDAKLVIRFLLDVGLGINTPATDHLQTPLQEAISRELSDIILRLLDLGVDVNASPATKGGLTALQWAAKQGMLSLAIKLVDLGADVAAPGAAEDGKTAINCAARYGRLNIIQLLLKAYNGVENIGLVSDDAADHAVKGGHFAFAEWLRAYPECKGYAWLDRCPLTG